MKSDSSKRGSEMDPRSDRPPMLLKVNRERPKPPVEVDLSDHQVKGNNMQIESGNPMKDQGNNGYNDNI